MWVRFYGKTIIKHTEEVSLRGSTLFLVINIFLALLMFSVGSSASIAIAILLLIEGFAYYFWSKR